MKRIFDFLLSAIGLLCFSPVILVFAIAVWLQDFHSPLYAAERVGLGGKPFRMVKLRSMVARADATGVTSTSDNDNRITFVGRLIRRFKLDEITQLWNVLVGEMSLVGPRPNVMAWGVELYTEEEMRLLSVKPGITDFASIVFADEGAILREHANPDLAYNQLIRPWKSRLSLFYVDRSSFAVDIKLVLITALSIFSRNSALGRVQDELISLGAPRELIDIAARREALKPFPPPGSTSVFAFND